MAGSRAPYEALALQWSYARHGAQNLVEPRTFGISRWREDEGHRRDLARANSSFQLRSLTSDSSGGGKMALSADGQDPAMGSRSGLRLDALRNSR